MSNTIGNTQLKVEGQVDFYRGKVREVYSLDSGHILSVATDRISAFDHILPKGIPFKGQVLNQLAAYFLQATADIVPNWLMATPDPNVSFGHRCEPYRVEMVIRGYLTGHAWRTYKAGGRMLCGVALPEGMKEHQKFDTPIITPATKADEGHDEDISAEDIVKQGIMSQAEYDTLEKYTRALFQKGTEMAAEQGLILVDTKYEFGKKGDEILLIDEVHTPDSSRYFYADTYQYNFDNDLPQRQLSKEFVREWLMENGFQGLEGQTMPTMDDAFVESVTSRYIELYEMVSGKSFNRADVSNIEQRLQENVNQFMATV